MAKLYPPHIEGSLPAFSGTMLRIPFEHSRAVSINDISGLTILVKNIQNSTVVTTWTVPKEAINNDTNEIAFPNVPISQIKAGNYYKIQIAYNNLSGQVGYFSDIGIIKYIQDPTVSIVGLNSIGFNTHQYHYELNYSCNDKEEKLYSTEFNLMKASTKEIIASSGEIIHNTNTDTITNHATEGYDFLYELDKNDTYIIQALITTTSGYEKVTPQYQIQAKESIPSNANWVINPVLDAENGCINVYTYSLAVGAMVGQYKLLRADEKEGYNIWHTLFDTSIDTSSDTLQIHSGNQKLLWRDFTVEQGQNYIYGLFQVNSKGTYSTRYQSNAVYADFEDSFLFDGEKQLRIRFNPQVSSFKTTLQETKTDTIGGKYPFISRNSDTYYKEFPISGLLSYLSDPNGYFNKDFAQLIEIGQTFEANRMYDTNLNSENIAAERQFKLEVLNWLNNGKPKLFRSPTEGNYLVRLLNVSLSPENTLGRMLHSFSATAYEIDKADPDTLIKYDLMGHKLLSGILKFESSTGQIAYTLNSLSPDTNLLDTAVELKDATVLQANFICGYNVHQNVQVNINSQDVNVYPNKTISAPITSIKASTHNFVPLSTDMIILSFKKAMNLDAFNGKISGIYTEGVPCAQYPTGFDLSGIGSKLKDFIARIYQLICSPRVLELINLVGSAINYLQMLLKHWLDGWTVFDKVNDVLSKYGINNCPIVKSVLEFIKDLITKDENNNSTGIPCLDSVLYVLKDTTGKILGIFDMGAKTFLQDGNGIITQIIKSAVTLTTQVIKNGSTILNETNIPISTKTIFGAVGAICDTVLPSNLTNIAANAFTCVEMVFKKAINVIETLPATNDLLLNFTDTYDGNNSLLALTKKVVETVDGGNSLTGLAASACETVYNTILGTTGLLKQGSVPTIGNSEDSCAGIEQTVFNNTTLSDIGNAAANVLNNGTVKNIIDITGSVLSSSLNVIGGLFGNRKTPYGGGC